MTRNEIQLLYEYDHWANARVLQAAASPSPEQFTQDLGSSFPSVRDTLVHILSGEWGWLEYWKGPSHDSGFLPDLKMRMETLFNPEAFPNLASLRRKWKETRPRGCKWELAVPQRAPNSLAQCSGGVGEWSAGSMLAST